MRTPDPRSADYPPAGAPPRPAPPGQMLVPRIRGRGFATTALTFAALTLILLPAVVGGVGFGVAAKRRGDPWGQAAIVASVVCFVVGVALVWLANDLDPDAFARLDPR